MRGALRVIASRRVLWDEHDTDGVAGVIGVERAVLFRLIDDDVQVIVVDRRADREAISGVVDRQHWVIEGLVLKLMVRLAYEVIA